MITLLALLLLPFCVQAQEFTNSLGMKMVPVPGTKILMATTEVTVDQYKAAGLGYEAPEFVQTGSHPAVNVNWNDAQKYVKWLSKKEGKKYRLPKDREWSCAVGIGGMESAGGSPASKSGMVADVFPWGRQGKGSPPPSGVGNYMGQEWRKEPGKAEAYFTGLGNFQLTLMPNFDDGQMFTAPVGSYKPNNLGIYDLGGNVKEWCEDKYGGGGNYSAELVARGGSWNDGERFNLLSSLRSPNARGFQSNFNGFRVVCEPGSDG